MTTESPASDPDKEQALRTGTAVAVGADGTAVPTVPASVTTFVVSGVEGVATEAPALRDGETYTVTGVQSGHALTASDEAPSSAAPGIPS